MADLRFEFDGVDSRLILHSAEPYNAQYHLRLKAKPGGASSEIYVSKGYHRVFENVPDRKEFGLKLSSNQIMYEGYAKFHYLYFDGTNVRASTQDEWNENLRNVLLKKAKRKGLRNRILWNNLFNFAFHYYPETPTPREQEIGTYLLEQLHTKGIHCQKCRHHYSKFLQTKYNNSVELIVSSKENLVKFLTELQNDVNASKGQAIFSSEQTREYYSNKEGRPTWTEKLSEYGTVLGRAFLSTKDSFVELDKYFTEITDHSYYAKMDKYL